VNKKEKKKEKDKERKKERRKEGKLNFKSMKSIQSGILNTNLTDLPLIISFFL
jgi:hypothetical protein